MSGAALILPVLALLGAEPALAANSAESDVRAEDAIALFRTFCVATKGDRSQAENVLGNGNPLAKKLPDAMMERLQGKPGGVGWALSSPRNAQLLLGYQQQSFCEVRIAEADETNVVSAYQRMIEGLAILGSGQQSKPETRLQNGANITYRQYDFTIEGRKALIALSTASQMVGEQQHLITFGFTS